MATPIGIIVMWNGTLATIPTGWNICDGTAGTPDLRSLFLAGASNDSEVGVSSGCAAHTHSTPSLNVSADHTHSVSGTTSTASTGGAYGSGAGYLVQPAHSHGFSGNTGWGGAHSHGTGTSGTGSVLPPYYKLYYIMKV